MAAQSKVIHNGSRHNRKGFGTEPLGGTEFLKSTENNRRIVCDAIPGRAEVSMGRGDDPGSSQQEKQRLTPVALTILSNPIRQIDGLYSLNDLHKASGGENKHRPNYFLSNEQTKALIDEIQIAGIPAISAKPRRGTYACRELVIAYAAWISAAFHLKVIRVFLGKEVSPQPVSNPDKFITPEQQGILFNLMAIRFPEGRDRPYGWSRFQRHFVVNSYKNLPADKFAQACCYIPAMPDKEVKALPAPEQAKGIIEWIDKLKYLDSTKRWMLYFEDAGTPSIKQIPDDACVMSANRLLEAINEPNGVYVSSEKLFAFVQATVKRLEQSYQYQKARAEGKPTKLRW